MPLHDAACGLIGHEIREHLDRKCCIGKTVNLRVYSCKPQYLMLLRCQVEQLELLSLGDASLLRLREELIHLPARGTSTVRNAA